jgi:16S rRNA C967 or C1407 C5-methylase (RsmB/RsmF family)
MEYSLPADFVDRIKKQFGVESERFLSSLNNSPENSIRLNHHKQRPNLVFDQAIPWCDHGYYLKQRPQYTLDPLFHAGSYYPQESSSMFLWHVLNTILKRDNAYTCLDLCAAPGGKTTLLAAFMDGKGVLVSNEVIRARTNILKENVIKWGYGNNIVTQNDPENFSSLLSVFDLVLVDAPCSGEGIFRKDPKSRQE